MEKKLSKPIKLAILILLSSMILLGVSGVRAIDSANTVWVWRQPPYENLGAYIIPSVSVVTWGGVDKTVIYAGNTDTANSSSIPYGIYRSTDYGLTWDYLGKPDEHEAIKKLIVHPTKPNIVIAGFNRTYYQGGIYRSEDNGENWTNVLPYLIVYDIEIDPSNPSIMYATGLGVQAGVYKSIDEGQTWQYISTSYFSDVAVNPTSPNILFAARRFSTNSHEGIYRSEDSGVTWTQISRIQESRILINANNPDQMFIFGESYMGIWRTDNAGVNWRNVTSNLPRIIAEPTILSAVIDPLSPNTVWIGLKYGGMYVSHDSGENWQEASYGIPSLGTGISGPQCTSSSISNSRLIIACSGRLYIQFKKLIKTIPSNAIADGWVLESTETSGKGGSNNNIATTFHIGDDISNKQYRSILSFDTSGLPVNAVITKISLNVKKQTIIGGGNPVIAFQGFIVDVKKGFWGLAALQNSDFQAAATKSYGPFIPTQVINWYMFNLSQAIPYFNRVGTTQIRLRFKLDDNNNNKPNFISFYSSNSLAANRPTLVIEYCVP